jgi:hypothetical protein
MVSTSNVQLKRQEYHSSCFLRCSNGKRVLKTTEFLLPGAEAWAPGPDLPGYGRFGSATAAVGPTTLVTAGGRGGNDSFLRTADMLQVRASVRDALFCVVTLWSRLCQWILGAPIPPSALCYTLQVAASRATEAPSAAWRPVAPMVVARAFAAAASPTTGPWAGRFVVTGGQTGAGSKATGVVEIYDPGENSWSRGPPLRTPRHGHVMWAERDGSLVVAGGRGSDGSYLRSCERLSSAAPREWQPSGDLPEARFRAIAVAV